MAIFYLIILFLFVLAEFRWSYNRSCRDIGNILELPADGGQGVGIITFVLFLLCEIFGVVAFGWLTLIVPYIFVLINAPRAQKKAIRKFIQDNAKAGISPEETIKLIASRSRYH